MQDALTLHAERMPEEACSQAPPDSATSESFSFKEGVRELWPTWLTSLWAEGSHYFPENNPLFFVTEPEQISRRK